MVVMRLIGIVVLVVLASRSAAARMMVHFDLAGLIVQSDAVVIADRVGPLSTSSNAVTKYRVVRSLRGTMKIGEEVEVWDSHFDRSGHAIDARAVLFLRTYSGKRELVASGLRVIEKGKVWRFEQGDNPGPYRMIPQGRDPQDQWENGGAQLDLAAFERAVTDAGKRVDAFTAAKAEKDPAKRRAAILALFTVGDASATGFYVDQLAGDAREFLAKAGDVDGALLVRLRDRGLSFTRSDYATLTTLLAIGKDTARPLDVREAALHAIGGRMDLYEDPAAMRDVIKLVADPSPRIRAAAVATAARQANITSGDPADQRKLNVLVAETRLAIAKQYVIEKDSRVITAVLEAYEDSFHKPAPPRSTGPLAVATIAVHGISLDVQVFCTRPAKIKGSKITLGSNGAAAPIQQWNVTVHCGGNPRTGAGSTTQIPVGKYDVAVELETTPATVLQLGTLTVDTAGEMHLAP